MSDCFLLYIDILGFAEMTGKEPRKVARTYAILDSLNVHKHQAFKTIVFSDTVLVYNSKPAQSDDDRSHYVWYLIEFAEDLHHRLTGQDVFFRAILTSGGFSHYSLENIQCFFGDALISAYTREKSIPSLGLFLDENCARHNKYFRTAPFDGESSFVYLNRSIEDLTQLTGDKYPFRDRAIEELAPFMPWQVRFLRDVHANMRSHRSPTVRAKFLTAWDFYAKRYPGLTLALVSSEFSLNAIAGPKAWNTEISAMDKSIKYYKRIGSGTSLSKQIGKSKLRGRSKEP